MLIRQTVMQGAIDSQPADAGVKNAYRKMLGQGFDKLNLPRSSSNEQIGFWI
jgi:hypothetical protein